MTHRWLVFAWALVMFGCGGTEVRHQAPGAGGAGGGSTTSSFNVLNNKRIDKVDLLFVIADPSSMADEQEILASSVPRLVQRLVSPNCVDASGTVMGQASPDPSAPCPAGSDREFSPITNIHIGIVTSSLGGHGASVCEDTASGNDHAELLGSLARGAATVYPPGTEGFLNWNPAMVAGADLNGFETSFQSMIRAAGNQGCLFGAPLEAMYRFLSDPFPPQSITLQTCRGSAQCATPSGVDTTVLAQRKAFLRPDSIVAIVLVTDQNDCSIRDSDQYYFAATPSIRLPAAASVCGTNPNDPCCYSCGLAPPSACPADPACGPPVPSLADAQDPPRLRCFDQKRRFGIDFLYPIERYVTALSSPQLCTTSVDLKADASCAPRADKSPGLVANPLFQDPTGNGIGRDPSLVYLSAIAGVPWQLIAQDPNSPLLHYKTATQLEADNTWGMIVGDPRNSSGPVVPTDPHMEESIDPRPGLPGPNTSALADPINGHEWNVTARDDLQYACIFAKPTMSSCTDSTCDCYQRSPGENNPLCTKDGVTYESTQYKSRAYPSLRELQLVHDFGTNGVLGSICPRSLVEPNAQDYGYGPALDALVDRLGDALAPKCLPRTLPIAPDGSVPCTIIEATVNPSDRTCDPARNRKELDPKIVDSARATLAGSRACDDDPSTALPPCASFTFCQILPADDTCLTGSPSSDSMGWCYVDPEANHGDPVLVAKCSATQRRIIRFVGDNTPARGATVLLNCTAPTIVSGAGGIQGL